jgi:branched-subunit amino acid transport protein
MIASGYFWANILMLGLGTFAIRYSLVSVSGRLQISARARELFSYIPAAVLPALITPMVFFHQGSVAWLAGKERVAVLLLTAAVCAFSRSTLITILFGLIGLYLLGIGG